MRSVYFNTARSYWRSAEHLNAANLKVTHPQAPVTFLFCHAIELYLKAYLRGTGKNIAQLKKIGHRVADLAKSSTESGFVIVPEQAEILSHIDDDDIAIEARYIVTGFKNMPTNEALSGVAFYLDQSICAALAKKGFAVRAESFRRPTAHTDEAEKAEEYIPFMTAKDKEIIAYLLHYNQRMFTCEPDGGHARLLLSRGIVYVAACPGQQVNYSDVPFEVPADVWAVLVKHKDKFPFLADDDDPHPWRVGWMER
jgi:hypothetical protein